MYIWGGVYNMYTGTLVDVINEATIKAPDSNVAGVHHSINARAAIAKRTGMNQAQRYSKENEGVKQVGRMFAGPAKAGFKATLKQKSVAPNGTLLY